MSTTKVTPEVLTVNPDVPAITLHGVIACHKQSQAGDWSILKLDGQTSHPVEVPDLRGTGFKPGDRVSVLIQKVTAKAAVK